jgi:hypothetical protein
MAKQTDKQRIVALQKALRIARGVLERAQFDGASYEAIEGALYEMGKLDWNSKPDLIQDRRATHPDTGS